MTQEPGSPIPPGGSPAQPPPGASAPQAIETNPDARQWGMFAHLSALAYFVGVPPIVGPLVIWLIKREQMPFVDDQGKEALNFQILMLIIGVISIPLACIGVGFVTGGAAVVLDLVFSIIAAMKAKDGIRYRYPLTIRFIK